MTMTHAVSSLVRRVDDTLDQAAGRFPMYADRDGCMDLVFLKHRPVLYRTSSGSGS
jgi:hypothetical protein